MRLTVGEIKSYAFDALAEDDDEIVLPASVVLDLLSAYITMSGADDDEELGE